MSRSLIAAATNTYPKKFELLNYSMTVSTRIPLTELTILFVDTYKTLKN